MPSAAPAHLQPFTSASGQQAALRGAVVRRRRAIKIEQLQALVDSLTADNIREAAALVKRTDSLKELWAVIRATRDRINHALANPFPGYAREVRELAAALTEFRRQESILLDRPRKRTGALGAQPKQPGKSRTPPTPAASPPATTPPTG